MPTRKIDQVSLWNCQFTQLSSVCAVLDAQGFVHEGKFIPREMALVGSNFEYNWEVKTSLDRGVMSCKDRMTNDVNVKHLGLALDVEEGTKAINYLDVGNHLKNLYAAISTTGRPRLAIKQHNLAPLLKENGIPFINLEESKFQCPSMNRLCLMYNEVKCCRLHTPQAFGEGPFRCSLKKASLLHQWIIRRKSGFILMSQATHSINKSCILTI